MCNEICENEIITKSIFHDVLKLHTSLLVQQSPFLCDFILERVLCCTYSAPTTYVPVWVLHSKWGVTATGGYGMHIGRIDEAC